MIGSLTDEEEEEEGRCLFVSSYLVVICLSAWRMGVGGGKAHHLRHLMAF